jgi:hypothetical protein
MSLEELEEMLLDENMKLLVIAGTDGYIVVYKVKGDLIKVAWMGDLSGPFFTTNIQPRPGRPGVKKKTQEPREKLIRNLFTLKGQTSVTAMRGLLLGLPPRVSPLPDVIKLDSLLDLAKKLGLSPFNLVNHLVEAGDSQGNTLEQMATELQLDPEVESAEELVALWSDFQKTTLQRAQAGNRITPYEVAVAIGLGDLFDKDATLEEVVAAIRERLQ